VFYLVYAIAGFLMGFLWSPVYAVFAAPFLGLAVTYAIATVTGQPMGVVIYLSGAVATTIMTIVGTNAGAYR
jgi:hypothetical protein